MTDDTREIVAELRHWQEKSTFPGEPMGKAADLIERQAKRIEELETETEELRRGLHVAEQLISNKAK